ncbi:MAG: hypothetical protein JXJ17_02575 [Anaerolineae bacterium]|nr:hypothetical protein [Anaerolineae bacterium]
MNNQPTTVIYQSAKLNHLPQLQSDFDLARRLEAEGASIGRIFGNSSGALAALAHAIMISARTNPDRFSESANYALETFAAYFRQTTVKKLRRFNLWALKYGAYQLDPLRRWLSDRLREYTGLDDLSSFTFDDLAVPVYLCVCDKDARPVFFGPPDDTLQADYHNCRTRIENAPLLDACIAAVSTVLAYDAVPVNGHYYKDGRPVFADISAMVADMEAADPRPIVKSEPYTPIPDWKPNALSQPFIMHRWHERNQAILAAYYNDLLARYRSLTALTADQPSADHAPQCWHIRLPYIGSTEAGTNMRQSIANKLDLMATFRELGEPQLEGCDFSKPTTLIYGAGGFSGIIAGLIMTRLVDAQNGNVERIFGCSAGVLNGLFHGVVLGARRHPDLYRPEALDALTHLEEFFDQLDPSNVYRLNLAPRRIARAVANMDPLKEQIAAYLERWTGCADGMTLTFEDIKLPFYAVGARGSDGFADFFGMADDLQIDFAGRRLSPINCPIVEAIVGGMAQPFYVTPPNIDGELYFDGGAAFYDIELFAAAMASPLPSLLSIHVVGPPDYSFGLDERLTMLKAVFDTHNLTFPEERRRMTALVNLLYAHEKLRRDFESRSLNDDTRQAIPAEGWWREWKIG